MTRAEMIKTNWKAYMTIEYKDKGMEHSAECLLSSVDFDSELLKLTPLNDHYEQNEFYGHIQFCTVSKRIRPVSIDGKIKHTIRENTLRAKKIGDYIEGEDCFNDAS